MTMVTDRALERLVEGKSAHEVDELAARMAGGTRTTMQRYRYVSNLAENESMPSDIREEAARWCELINEAFEGTPHRVSIWAAYRRMRQVVADRMEFSRVCAGCGEEFTLSESSRRRHCSDACRQRAYRERS
jgi:hypothetical protein